MRFVTGYFNRRYRIAGAIILVVVLALTVTTIVVGGDEVRGLGLALIPTWSFAFITAFLMFGKAKQTYEKDRRVDVFSIAHRCARIVRLRSNLLGGNTLGICV